MTAFRRSAWRASHRFLRRRVAIAAFSCVLGAVGVACGGAGAAPRASSALPEAALDLDAVADELEAMNEPFVQSTGHRETFRAILADTIDKDSYLCMPSPRALFFGGAPEGERAIRGSMPHYGFYFGPMSYVVRRAREPERWEVFVRVALELPPEDAWLELPDCGLKGELGADLACEGTPYALSGTTDACPGSGSFRAKASRRAVSALLARWSKEAEVYWTRDAAALGLPITYDFDFVPASEAASLAPRVDMVVPLAPTCGRTPYFSAMRAGWSTPILAHEVGHIMGLLDEYEMLSGITPAYPKTPFPGAEVSRMGLSMREGSKVLPLHHYLILRRYVCPEPARHDRYPRIL